ncbi:MAG: type I methionyl aminopeptidase [Phycisphaerae bacterium]|nr:type I methionyl aminopeptidase [Phycisphaerae bacterium]
MASRVRRSTGIVLKSAREIELMRQAGRIVGQVLDRMEELVKPGVTTGELNEVAEKLISDAGGVALFKGVRTPHARIAFPAALCTSVNDEVVHGIPGDRCLREGDVVSIDCGVRLNGYCGDSARTFPVGRVNDRVGHLLDVTRRVLELAISRIREKCLWSEIAGEMQAFVEGHDLSVVRDFVGHGIGRDMHEDPKVPNYHDRAQKKSDFVLERGLVLAIEPMVNLGSARVQYARPDHWAVVTEDGSHSAHFEHTVAVTRDGGEILTWGDRR